MSNRQAAEALLPDVSRETWDRLAILIELLGRWQQTINLIAASTLPEVWTRHIADSLQMVSLAPDAAKVWVDLGSGAGFPGLVIAAALADRPGVESHLVESDSRKCAFLREGARAMGLRVSIHNQRAAPLLEKWAGNVDVVTARALAPVSDLLALAYPLLDKGAVGLFPKGRDVETELTAAAKSWKLIYEVMPSIVDPRSCVLAISRAEPLEAFRPRR
ncbi:16S rRNA (guanine(527)-N(7))-methyltransferase RsmG [Terrihabitans sp. B22-R8]|uniref:16S rRNA (guanine(527)-N(7))-methyltransferase RsmG n=1 Tax=Terrihabitans sp. B22-R8 TaxID=3425128 RepID=UPI00403C54BD